MVFHPSGPELSPPQFRFKKWKYGMITPFLSRISSSIRLKPLLCASILMIVPITSCQNKSDMSNQTTDTPRNPYYSRIDTMTLHVPDSVWKEILPANVYAVSRNKGTEMAFTGKYWDFTGIGTYYCAACGNKLFRSDAKFGSTCGWPSFFETVRENAVQYQQDLSYGMDRVEVLCGRCGGHLGHLFDDGPPPTGKRYCMNSVVLDFVPDDSTKTE